MTYGRILEFLGIPNKQKRMRGMDAAQGTQRQDVAWVPLANVL